MTTHYFRETMSKFRIKDLVEKDEYSVKPPDKLKP